MHLHSRIMHSLRVMATFQSSKSFTLVRVHTGTHIHMNKQHELNSCNLSYGGLGISSVELCLCAPGSVCLEEFGVLIGRACYDETLNFISLYECNPLLHLFLLFLFLCRIMEVFKINISFRKILYLISISYKIPNKVRKLFLLMQFHSKISLKKYKNIITPTRVISSVL